MGFAGGDFNLHAYVGNSSTNYVDPSGQVPGVIIARAASVAIDIAAYHAFGGRKVSIESEAKRAARGCISGVLGYGIGKGLRAAFPVTSGSTATGASVAARRAEGFTESQLRAATR
ncbi:MAG: hypothetical protein WEC75_11765 [Dehalococcoidia bacterium]